jgi:hypothetical protein
MRAGTLFPTPDNQLMKSSPPSGRRIISGILTLGIETVYQHTADKGRADAKLGASTK